MNAIVSARNAEAAIQIAKIEKNKKEKLSELSKKFAIPDGIKSTAGIIGILALASMSAMILLIDFINFMMYLFVKKGQIAHTKANSQKSHRKKKQYIYVP